MFTPENLKKLTNVSVVSLKKYGKRYELALYPNKLYEFRKDESLCLDKILHTDKIYRNVSKGNKADLELFNLSNIEIIKEILKYGIEQKDEKTRNYEINKKETEIVSIIQKKVLDLNGKYLSFGKIKDLMRKSQFIIDLDKESKMQANDIIKRLGDSVKKVRMEVELFCEECDLSKILHKNMDYEIVKINMNSIFILVYTDDYKILKDIADNQNIGHVLHNSAEVEEEEIC
ncbi:SBDS domain-containing protein [Hamiltosporidium magnivora]|uniref:SBDS domain-containing protein n=1 Tax=Hamiltosporidium magnivora TaxID=148818 RepID=A0A4Q9L7T4_9MICR|nr:SBDS domain-containing protein [Hamiltosporidium magnivora]